MQRELGARWAIDGDFRISSFADAVLVFTFPNEETKNGVFEKGPWSLVGQLRALEW